MHEETKKPEPYMPRSDEDLEKLAWDTVEGRVFHSMYNHISPQEMTMVFIAIAFADQTYIDWMKESQIGDLYEYLDKALPRGVNGMPMFTSCSVLSKEDAARLDKRVQEIQDFKKGRIEGAKV